MEIPRTLQTADGSTIAYRLWRGDAPVKRTVVLLHGMASNLTRWSEFVEHTTLKQGWNILRLDLRGHGESFVRGRLDMERWCDDLRALLDAEGVGKAVLIGHSLGAQLAVHFAASHPSRVQGLVLIDPVFQEAMRGGTRWARRLAPVLRCLVALILFMNRLGLRRRHIPNRDLRKMDQATRAKLLEAGKQSEMITLYSSPWEDLRFFPVASYLQEMLEITRALPPLARIPAPVLALLSKGLTYTDPEITRALLARHPLAQTLTLDAYHWPLTENPIQVREVIEDWCGSLA